MSILQVQQRTASGLTNVGQFPQSIVGSMGSAIIESGSNANGNYVKFADGTLICYNMNTVKKDGNWGSSRYFYPSSFVDSYPNIFTQYNGLTSQSDSGFRVTEVDSYNSSYTIKLLQLNSAGSITLPDSGSIFTSVLGKWK